jgi:choline monooxygenase
MHKFFVDPDISVAKTLHTDFYTDPTLFEESKEKLFASSWQFVGDTGLVSQQGSIYPFTLLKDFMNEPLMLTRNKENEVSCLSNVCTHRGNILAEKPYTSAHIRCRYHGRVFSIDGKFQSMPEFKEVKNFPCDDDNLHKLKLYNWGNLLFANAKEEKPSSVFLDDMIKRLEWLPVHEFVPSPKHAKDYYVNAHWALYCENYLEGFHIPFVHADLNQVIDYGNYTTELFPYSVLQLGIAKSDEDCFDLPSGSLDYGKKVAAYYYFVFPNMMFNFYPWGLSVNIVEPVSINRTRICFRTYIWKKSLFNTGAGGDLDTVEMEDEAVVENVQTGIRSRFYKHGRYSVTREQGVHHFHRLLAENIQ